MPIFSTYPQITVLAPTDSFLIAQAATGGSIKTIEIEDLQANLSLPSISGILPLSKGGTGISLSSPGQDSIVFWDNSAAKVQFLSVGDGLEIIGTVLSLTSPGGGGGGGGAPTGATYITQLPNADLTNEFALSTLPTGILKSTTVTGALGIATPGEDYAIGPGASTNNALVRFNGTPGGVLKDSNVTLADAGTTLQFSGAAGLSAGGSNQNVNLTPTGTGVVLLGSALQTSPASGGSGGKLKFGQVKSGTVALDTTSYVEISLDGAIIKLLKAT